LAAPAKLTIAITRRTAGLRKGKKCVAPTGKLRRAHAKRCTRTITAGTLTRANVPAGAGGVVFTGRIGHRPLKPHSYKAVLTASNSAGRSNPAGLSFAIVR
jgi:hypothetical protein